MDNEIDEGFDDFEEADLHQIQTKTVEIIHNLNESPSPIKV